MTARLLVATDASSAGLLKGCFPADRRGVAIVDTRLVRDPAPHVRDIEAFFAERDRLHDADPSQFGSWLDDDSLTNAGTFAAIAAGWPNLDRAEFWANPDANGQLLLLLFLAWIGRERLDPHKLFLVQGDKTWAELRPDDPALAIAERIEVGAGHLELAERAWSAFCSPTPERWADLLEADLSPLPRLRGTVATMLGELPDSRTGLSASERLALSTIAPGDVKESELFYAFSRSEPAVLDYWEVGKLLDLLADPRDPLIHGLKRGSFDMRLHMNEAGMAESKNSRLSLTPLGTALLSGRDDFSRHGLINRWWGGTHLTGADCWRWDAERHALLPPC